MPAAMIALAFSSSISHRAQPASSASWRFGILDVFRGAAAMIRS